MLTEMILENSEGYSGDKHSKEYDGLWKKVIEDLFAEFMQFFAPDLFNQINFSKQPDFLKQELFQEIIETNKGKRIADEIVKVFLKSGEEKWILIHIEVQGEPEADFGKRMFQYFYRIYDRYDREIYAIAIVTDRGRSKHVEGFNYSFFGTKLDYKYNVYLFDENRLPELEESDNPFAVAIMAGIYARKAKNDDEKRYQYKRQLIIKVLKKFSRDKENARTYLTALVYFIDYLLQIPAEYNKRLRHAITPHLEKEVRMEMKVEKESPLLETIDEVFEELEQKGREKGRQEMFEFLKLVREGLTDGQISKKMDLSILEVAKLRRSFME